MKIIGGPFPLYHNSQCDMEARGIHKKLHMDNNSVTNHSLIWCILQSHIHPTT